MMQVTDMTAADRNSHARPAFASPLSEQAHRAVTQHIRDRTLRGGDTIVEQRLAASLGISRTPLREALQRLEGEGLVVKTSGRSFAVRKVDLSEYLQSLKTRQVLEGEAAALAAGRVPPAVLASLRADIDRLREVAPGHSDAHWRSDDDVHNAFADHCGNAVMARLIRGLRVATRLFEIAGLAERVDHDSREHLAIVDALEAGGPDAARIAVQAHIRSLMDHSLTDLR